MPYSKSRSRQSFEINLRKLRELSKTASYKKSHFSYDHKNLVCQSAIFLACASIEEYLKNFLEDLIFELKSNSAKLSEVPINARALKLLNTQTQIIKSFIFNGDESKTIKSLNNSWSNYEIVDDTKILSYHVTAQDIIGTKKYPSIRNLKVLYNRIGIPDIFKTIEVKGHKDYKSLLESFLSVREAISHQAAPTVTYDDVKRHFENVSDLINWMDRVKYSHIVNVSGEKYWPK